MTLYFTKMHGLGNDFMVIDAIHQAVHLDKDTIIALGRRDTGVGFDQCLLVEAPRDAATDFFYRIYNADGQEVGQCGNGARCLARFVNHYKLTDKQHITVATKTTRMHLQINADDTVTVDFGLPFLEPTMIPVKANSKAELYLLPLQSGADHSVHAVGVGNPHAVTVVHNVMTAPVTSLGKEISEHPLFPEQTNAGFMEIIDASSIRLRVYERGCGETSACGSGAVAAAIIGRLYHGLDPRISVTLPGGRLIVDWPDMNSPVSLTGPACFVYEGSLI